jgi:DNA-binding phage protein
MKKTGFDRYFDRRIKDQSFAAGYAAARAEIDSVDELMRQLEAARVESGLTKAEIARRAGTSPEAVRRLFTMESPNPTMSTVVTLARTMGLSIALVPARRGVGARRAKKAA